MVDLLVSIVNTDRRALLKQCLDALPAAVGSLSAVVVVLDNASRDGSADMVDAYEPPVTLIRQDSRRGFAANHNRVMTEHAGSSRYVLLLNEDTEADPGALERMVRYMDQHPRVGITGARLVYSDGRPQSSYAAFPKVLDELLYVWAVGRLVPKHLRPKLKRVAEPVRRWLPAMTATYLSNWTSDHREPQTVDWVCGACFMVRREVIEEIGLLDEAFFIYFEETDWCKRAAASGWKTVHVPEARVQHHEAASRGRLSTLAFQRSGCRYFAKHGRSVDKYLFRLGVWLNAGVMIGCTSVAWLLRPSQRKANEYAMQTYWQVLRDRSALGAG
jgi:GT2 family glycosyltransferase